MVIFSVFSVSATATIPLPSSGMVAARGELSIRPARPRLPQAFAPGVRTCTSGSSRPRTTGGLTRADTAGTRTLTAAPPDTGGVTTGGRVTGGRAPPDPPPSPPPPPPLPPPPPPPAPPPPAPPPG